MGSKFALSIALLVPPRTCSISVLDFRTSFRRWPEHRRPPSKLQPLRGLLYWPGQPMKCLHKRRAASDGTASRFLMLFLPPKPRRARGPCQSLESRPPLPIRLDLTSGGLEIEGLDRESENAIVHRGPGRPIKNNQSEFVVAGTSTTKSINDMREKSSLL